MTTNIFTSMMVRKSPNWIVDAALREHGIAIDPAHSFKTIRSALSVLINKPVKPPPYFILLDQVVTTRALKYTAQLAYGLMRLGSMVIIVTHDEGGLGQLSEVSFNHGTESVLDTNLGAFLDRRIESL